MGSNSRRGVGRTPLRGVRPTEILGESRGPLQPSARESGGPRRDESRLDPPYSNPRGESGGPRRDESRLDPPYSNQYTRSTDQHGRAAEDDRSAVFAEIALAGRGLVADHRGDRAHRDGVGRTDADGHVADPRCGHAADQHGRTAGRQDRTADVGDRRDVGGDHRADVHVTGARRRAFPYAAPLSFSVVSLAASGQAC